MFFFKGNVLYAKREYQVNSAVLEIFDKAHCGGNDVHVEIFQGDRSMKTETSSGFWRGKTFIWWDKREWEYKPNKFEGGFVKQELFDVTEPVYFKVKTSRYHRNPNFIDTIYKFNELEFSFHVIKGIFL